VNIKKLVLCELSMSKIAVEQTVETARQNDRGLSDLLTVTKVSCTTQTHCSATQPDHCKHTGERFTAGTQLIGQMASCISSQTLWRLGQYVSSPGYRPYSTLLHRTRHFFPHGGMARLLGLSQLKTFSPVIQRSRLLMIHISQISADIFTMMH